MTGSEQRKIMCSVTFHIIAITCVVWSLYVLIDRTAEEIKRGESTGMLLYFLSNKKECSSHDKLPKIRETFFICYAFFYQNWFMWIIWYSFNENDVSLFFLALTIFILPLGSFVLKLRNITFNVNYQTTVGLALLPLCHGNLVTH